MGGLSASKDLKTEVDETLPFSSAVHIRRPGRAAYSFFVGSLSVSGIKQQPNPPDLHTRKKTYVNQNCTKLQN